MPLTSPGNDDDTGENHQPTLRKNTAEPAQQTLKQYSWNPDSYRPRDPDEELKLAKRLEGIARERDLDSLEQLDRLTATIRATIGPRGGMRP